MDVMDRETSGGKLRNFKALMPLFIDLMHQRNVGAVIFRILSLNFRFCGRFVYF